MINIDKAIALAVKTGKVSFGANSALQNAKTGKSKLILLASNCPKAVKDDIEYYGKLSKIPVLFYKGTSIDLAEVAGKLFIISALSIREAGDSDILKLIENPEIQGMIGGEQ